MAPRAHRPRRASAADVESLSLEDQLHRVHQRFALLADLFELHAVVPDHLRDGPFSAPASQALTAICREVARDVRYWLAVLPAELMNWTPRPPRRATRHGDRLA
jgi:hypothetical protein